MDYELALKLKEKGFPQTDEAWYYTSENTWMYCGITHHLDGMVMKPTLSELIEACGDNFIGLNKCDGVSDPSKKAWKATGYKGDGFLYCTSLIREIAVANLWLELNKK